MANKPGKKWTRRLTRRIRETVLRDEHRRQTLRKQRDGEHGSARASAL